MPRPSSGVAIILQGPLTGSEGADLVLASHTSFCLCALWGLSPFVLTSYPVLSSHRLLVAMRYLSPLPPATLQLYTPGTLLIYHTCPSALMHAFSLQLVPPTGSKRKRLSV